MHWTRQQRRLLYTLASFFIMSLYFVRLASFLPISGFLFRILALTGLVVLGKIYHQEAFPWEIPLYYVCISLLGLLPFQKVFGGFAYPAMILALVLVSLLYVYLLRPKKIKELFGGNFREVFQSPWSFPQRWYQVIPLFAVLCLAYFVFRNGGKNLLQIFRGDTLSYVLLQGIQLVFACFSIPLLFLKDKLEEGDALIILALGFGLFGRYLLMGSYLSILLHFAVGYLLAKATHETKGSLGALIMVCFYLLLGI